MDRVSIIIPVHGNRVTSGLFAETMATVAAQTYPSIQTIVVSDDADGDVIGACRGVPGLCVLLCGKIGLAAARNRGIEFAIGDWILPFDSDDLMEPAFVETLIANSEGVDGVYSDWYTQPIGCRERRRGHFDHVTVHTVEAMLERETVPHHTMVRRWVYDAGVRYDETNESAVDLDIKLQWVTHTQAFRRVPKPLWELRWHKHGRETRTKRQAACVAKIREEWRAKV